MTAGLVEVVGRGATKVITGGEVATVSKIVTGVMTKGRTEAVA